MKWLISILILVAVLFFYFFVIQELDREGVFEFKGPKEIPSTKGPGGLPPNR